MEKKIKEIYELVYKSCPKSYGTIHLDVLEHVLSRNSPKNIRILELGCGTGHLSNFCYERGHFVIASDVSGQSLKKCKENYPQICCCQIDAEIIPFKNSSFDIVFSSDLLEHLFDVEAHLNEIHRILKEGGGYIIKTPNKWLDYLYFKLIKKYGSYEISHPSTQSYFELKKIFDEYGFGFHFYPVKHLSETQIEKLKTIPLFSRFEKIVTPFFSAILFFLPIFFHPSFTGIAIKTRKNTAQSTERKGNNLERNCHAVAKWWEGV